MTARDIECAFPVLPLASQLRQSLFFLCKLPASCCPLMLRRHLQQLPLPLGSCTAAAVHAPASTNDRVDSGVGNDSLDLPALTQLYLELCKRHNPRLYRSLPDDDPTTTRPPEAARCWQWMQRQAAAEPGGVAAPAAPPPPGASPSEERALAVFCRAAELFRQELLRMGCVRVAELPLLARELLSRDAGVQAQVRARWQHLLVDELQDLQQVQVRNRAWDAGHCA